MEELLKMLNIKEINLLYLDYIEQGLDNKLALIFTKGENIWKAG